MITKKQIEEKRQQVRHAYSILGLKSKEYTKQFDELHTLNLKYMDEQYRKERGLSQGCKVTTPYSKEL